MSKILSGIGVLVLIGLVIYLGMDFLDSDKTSSITGNVIDSLNAEDSQTEEIYDKFPNAEGVHWTMMPISYNVVGCTQYQENRIVKAFNKIQDETEEVVSFEEYDGEEEFGAGFMIYCHEDFNYNYSESDKSMPESYTLGDSYYEVYDEAPDKILYADINFYGITETTYTGGCVSYPDVELHEILHGFGFEHVNQHNHIMNPFHTYCPSKLNQDIVDELLETYGNKG